MSFILFWQTRKFSVLKCLDFRNIFQHGWKIFHICYIPFMLRKISFCAEMATQKVDQHSFFFHFTFKKRPLINLFLLQNFNIANSQLNVTLCYHRSANGFNNFPRILWHIIQTLGTYIFSSLLTSLNISSRSYGRTLWD